MNRPLLHKLILILLLGAKSMSLGFNFARKLTWSKSKKRRECHYQWPQETVIRNTWNKL